VIEELSELVIEIHLVGQVADSGEVDQHKIEDGRRVQQEVVAVDAGFCDRRRSRFDWGARVLLKGPKVLGLSVIQDLKGQRR
jgi:hypothetical protein